MKIAYYMPFKPMGHPNPSGDLVIGTELYQHLLGKGHAIELVSRLRCRWIYFRPLALLRLLRERNRVVSRFRNSRLDLWLSYHCYYKAPDLLGSACRQKLGIPYAIFQGIYSTKRRRHLATLPGFLLNRRILLAADHVFANKKGDYANLQRLLPEPRLSYIAPGIHPRFFVFAEDWRNTLRQRWRVAGETVVMTAAMMRPGVKTAGLTQVIESCAELRRQGLPLRLIIAGDGDCRPLLEKKAALLLADKALFLGKIPRHEMYRYYSAADLFAFPGIEESLGMVYLEAQSCNLPVVACRDWGASEAVVDGQTGLLSPAAEGNRFSADIRNLVEHPELRGRLAGAAGKHVRLNHDLDCNYGRLESRLLAISGRRHRGGRTSRRH